MNRVRRFLRLVFRPHRQPEIERAIKVIEVRKEAAVNLRETLQRLAEKM